MQTKKPMNKDKLEEEIQKSYKNKRMNNHNEDKNLYEKDKEFQEK